MPQASSLGHGVGYHSLEELVTMRAYNEEHVIEENNNFNDKEDLHICKNHLLLFLLVSLLN